MNGDIDRRSAQHGNFASYTIGLILSILLTLTAYFLVFNRLLNDAALISSIVGLALVQMVVQLVFFFHMGREAKPYWNALAFLFMLVVTVILVGGSLWIMFDLDNRVMMPPMQKEMR